jgi:hypothetical protein
MSGHPAKDERLHSFKSRVVRSFEPEGLHGNVRDTPAQNNCVLAEKSKLEDYRIGGQKRQATLLRMKDRIASRVERSTALNLRVHTAMSVTHRRRTIVCWQLTELKMTSFLAFQTCHRMTASDACQVDTGTGTGECRRQIFTSPPGI